MALLAAACVHAVVAWALVPRDRVEIETARGGEPPRLGAFADLAGGTVRPVTAERTIRAVTGESRDAERAPRPRPDDDTVARSPEKAPARGDALVPVRPEGTIAAAEAPKAERAPASRPVTRAESPGPEDRITATAADSAAVTRSLRPAMRSADVESRAAATRVDTESEPEPRGPAPRNSRSGARTGDRDATSATQGTSGGSRASPGSAAASSYPGRIQAKLARTRRPQVSVSGVARVRMTISASGGIASVRLLQSSGSRTVDEAALRFVSSAAPFPAPPAGAQRTYDIPVRFAR